MKSLGRDNMKAYFFEAYDRYKKKVSFTLDFENNNEFYRYLKKNRLKLIKYKVIKRKYRISQREIIEFTQNLKILLESRLTITQALEILSKQRETKISNIVQNIYLKILEGNNLYTAFSMYRDIFGEGYLNIILSGEESGKILENLERIYRNLLFEEKIKRKIKEAVFYPMIILVFTFLLIIFILTFVLPNFIEFFKDIGTQLPLLTKVLIYMSNHIILINMVVIFIITLIYVVIKKLNIEKIEKLKLNLPIFGKLLKKRLLIEFCKNFSVMNEAGIEIIDILEILKKGSNYSFEKREFYKIQTQIKIGNSMYEALNKTDFFTLTQLYLIDIGEKSGTLGRAFENISITLEKELEFYLFKLTSLLEPILLLILGVIVGIIILGIYLPIFNISEII